MSALITSIRKGSCILLTQSLFNSALRIIYLIKGCYFQNKIEREIAAETPTRNLSSGVRNEKQQSGKLGI